MKKARLKSILTMDLKKKEGRLSFQERKGRKILTPLPLDSKEIGKDGIQVGLKQN